MATINNNTSRQVDNVAGYVGVGTGEAQYPLDIIGKGYIKDTHVDNDFSVGLSSVHRKKNTDGSGWASSVYSGNFHSIADSTEQINNVVGARLLAEHVGSGQSYFILGAESRAYHNGSGNTGGMYGINVSTRVLGAGAGDHGFVIGVNAEALLENPNATIDYLQGMHLAAKLKAGEVTNAIIVQTLDFDYSGGTLSGDFDYLRIKNDPMPSVGGTARAINSLSVLPSEFGGSIKSAGLINSAVAEHADNAAAVTAGLETGTHYRTGDLLKIVH